jgi:hypothetical protein
VELTVTKPEFEDVFKKTVDKGPRLYQGQKKDNIDWDRISDIGNGENPFSDKVENKNYFWLCLCISVALFVAAFILDYLGFPLQARFGGRVSPWSLALMPWLLYILKRTGIL